MRKVVILFFCSCAAPFRAYSPDELTSAHEISAPGKGKNQIYWHSMAFFKGPAGFYSYKGAGSRNRGSINANIEIDGDISPLHNLRVAMNMDVLVSDGEARMTFSNPRLVEGGAFVFGKYAPVNMPGELEGYRAMAAGLAERYGQYLRNAPVSPGLENADSYVRESGEF